MKNHSGDQIKKTEMGDVWGRGKVHTGKVPLERPRCRWKDNTKMDLREVVSEGMNCIDLAQDGGRVAGSCECGNEHLCSINCGEFPD
jgi:hypothetical protein